MMYSTEEIKKLDDASLLIEHKTLKAKWRGYGCPENSLDLMRIRQLELEIETRSLLYTRATKLSKPLDFGQVLNAKTAGNMSTSVAIFALEPVFEQIRTATTQGMFMVSDLMLDERQVRLLIELGYQVEQAIPGNDKTHIIKW